MGVFLQTTYLAFFDFVVLGGSTDSLKVLDVAARFFGKWDTMLERSFSNSLTLRNRSTCLVCGLTF